MTSLELSKGRFTSEALLERITSCSVVRLQRPVIRNLQECQGDRDMPLAASEVAHIYAKANFDFGRLICNLNCMGM